MRGASWAKTTNSNPEISPRRCPSAAVSRSKPLRGSRPPPHRAKQQQRHICRRPKCSRAKACSIGFQRSVSRQFVITDTGQSRINALSHAQAASHRRCVTICMGSSFFVYYRFRSMIAPTAISSKTLPNFLIRSGRFSRANPLACLATEGSYS